MARMEIAFRRRRWYPSTTKRPPSSGGMGSMFIMPSDTESIAVNDRALVNPCSIADFDMTAMPTTDVELETVSAMVWGLNSPMTA